MGLPKALDSLFKKLGYSEENGLFILGGSNKSFIKEFPSRFSRVITEVIRPYAIFSLDARYKTEKHVEPFNNPLILFYYEPNSDEYRLIPKHSFNLSRSPVIIVIRNGVLEIFNGFDFDDQRGEWLKELDFDLDLLSVKSLRSGRGWRELYEKFFKKSKTVDRYLLSNITDARRILIAEEPDFPAGNLIPEVANRLIGRLIFIRYLIDRNVVFNDQNLLIGSSKEERQQSLNQMLLDHKRTYDFFDYINDKFKGDLFPLTIDNEGFPFEEREYVRPANLKILYFLLTSSDMFFGDKVRGYSVQPSMFNLYDFEIIPVELISNIYESFLGNTSFSKSGRIETKLSKQEEVKAYYTPPFLVDYILNQTVRPYLEQQESRGVCKVLDPACGSGIFLVEALRQIIDINIEQKNFSSDELIPNDLLWDLLEANIFGLDIDPNAIEITTFSLYITLLDYKTHPREIENFEFRPLKGKNLFGGNEADFFNQGGKYNQILKEQDLAFIIGNPPWGQVKESRHLEYIRSISVKKKPGYLNPTIGNKEISQAFIIRAGEFATANLTKICFIITGKNLYNSNQTAVKWRAYFLKNFHLHQVFDLFGVNNKLSGGNKIFENANQPPAIILYSKKSDNWSAPNVVKHIVARANHYYHYFKTIVIEKGDVKFVRQSIFEEDDRIWKVLLYGSFLDYFLIKRLRSNFPTIEEVMETKELQLKGGIKPVDTSIAASKRKDASVLWNYDYLEVDGGQKDLGRYYVHPSKKFKLKLQELFERGKIKEDLKIAQLPDPKYFKGPKLLIKKGLDQYLSHGAVSAVTEKDCVFSSTTAAISSFKLQKDDELEDVLYAMAAIFNSKVFTYFLLMTSSSFGADRNRFNYREFGQMPFVMDKELVRLSRLRHSTESSFFSDQDLDIREIDESIEEYILKLFGFNEVDRAMMNYAVDVSIPVMKRADKDSQNLPDIFLPIEKKDEYLILSYAEVFHKHFGKRFNSRSFQFISEIYIDLDYIAIHFVVSSQNAKPIDVHYASNISNVIEKIGHLGFYELSSSLYVQQDVRGFNKDSFYVIKPNVRKNWHLAKAHQDVAEFIEAIAMSELKSRN